MEVQFSPEEISVVFIRRTPMAFLFGIHRFPNDILPRGITDTSNPALGAIPNGVPFIIPSEPAIFTVFNITQIKAIAARLFIISIFIIQTQSDAVVL